MIYWIDLKDRKGYYIINDKDKLQKMYDKYKTDIWIGYNVNHFDKYIIQGILCDFDPFEITQWIIAEGQQGWAFSNLLRRFPMTTFDVMQPNKGLKQCQASMGIPIIESSIPFDIDRKLTNKELMDVLSYCKSDAYSTFEVFLQDGFYLSPQSEFQSSMAIIDEFKFPKWFMSKTKSQMGCEVLGANYNNKLQDTDDEFDIINPTNVILGKYEYIREWFLNTDNHWYNKEVEGRKRPVKNEFVTTVGGLETTLAWGGSHGSVQREIIDGDILLCDFSSLYPNIMVEYNLVSRGVPNPKRYKELLETRMRLKDEGNDRQESYKIALNGSYGQMKYKGSPLYDPRNANNVCVHGQLISVDLVDKIEQFGDILNINTDGVVIRVHSKIDRENVIKTCDEVAKRLRIDIGIDYFKRFILQNVNNYIAITDTGKVIAKGGYVKYKNPLEYNYNIINHAIREYFVNNVSVRDTIYSCNNLMDFQIIANAGMKYKYAVKDTIFKEINIEGKRIRVVDVEGRILTEKVNRVFASKDSKDGGIFKVHKETGTNAKIEMTPLNCFILNGDIRNMEIPNKLNREWYVELAKRRCKEFVK